MIKVVTIIIFAKQTNTTTCTVNTTAVNEERSQPLYCLQMKDMKQNLQKHFRDVQPTIAVGS
jgi:hypothetical protein